MAEQLLDFGLHVNPGKLHLDQYFEGLLRTTSTQTMHYNVCPDAEAEARGDEIKDQIASGELPPIGYFALVLERRYIDFIPDRPYTQHFSNFHAPVAAPGLPEHEHDVRHVIAYERQFRSILFASVVARGSQNALTLNFTDDFTGAMDAFGDHCLDVIEGFAAEPEFADARVCLAGLVDFCRFKSQVLRDGVYRQLCVEMGISESDEFMALLNPNS